MKKIYLLCLMLSISVWANAQATSLTVDCQTPGWLSSMINYGDQQTVHSLKVTGYINKTDLKFIGSLIQDQSLNEQVDLSDVNVIDNKLENNVFGISKEASLRALRLPHTVTSVSSMLPYNGSNLLLPIDSLYFNCDMLWIKSSVFGGGQFGEMPKHIVVGEKTDSIPEYAFDREKRGLESVTLPKNIRYIGNAAFSIGCNVNFNDLENLEYLGWNAFCHYKSGLVGTYQPDTIIVPHSLNNPFYLFAFTYRDGQHIFIDDNINAVSGYTYTWDTYYTTAQLHFHINNMIPPSIINYSFNNSDVNLSTSYVYVPKGAKQAYLKSSWKNATIIEANPIEAITLDKHEISINKGVSEILSASIYPIDADNKTLIWSSSNEEIATVDEAGHIIALKVGETWVKVFSLDNPEAKDSCKVIVLQPVTGVVLNQNKHTFDRIGASYQLTAIVEPEDASNKELMWKSYNESVCIVNKGLLVATGYGTTIVTCTTNDGGFMDYCTITVEDNTPISGIDAEVQGYNVFDMKGVQRNRLLKGLNIIRFSDGTTKKVVVK